MKSFLPLFLITILNSPSLLAQNLVNCEDPGTRRPKISGTGITYEIQGQCERVEIDGYRNVIRIEQSTVVEVDGAENSIRIGQVGRLKVDGLENTLCYERLSGKLESTGLRNRVNADPNCLGRKESETAATAAKPAAAEAPRATASAATTPKTAPDPPSPAPAPPPAPKRTWGKECAETGKARVSGLGSNVRILGPCAEVEISGTGNRVEIHDVEKVILAGTGNQVEIHPGPGGRRAKVVDRGIGNNVQEK